ncbi:putative carboxylesterase 2 [Citrus sinensis]|uniref:Carboxylesterase 2 n=1 Tax=Citrus sinensis TaxID=2711 RepID=A0ACB8KV43_CITSI|nr:putative carboxylesterase 2 [Citrus sinensis]
MGSIKSAEVSREVFPYLRVYEDGTVERLAGTEVAAAGLDPATNVLSKDVLILPETGVSARVYRPGNITNKLPLVVYFHGGAFVIASSADPKYHTSLNNLVAEADIILVSVNYRLAPEHPLPAAFEDSLGALKWVASHAKGEGDGNGPLPVLNQEAWLREFVDFDKVFLAGDSAGSSIAHYLGLKQMVDNWWLFVCPSDKGCDDPLINPLVEGAPSAASLACEKLLVIVAEKDVLKDRGRLYYENLVKGSNWAGKADFVQVQGEDHVFHILDPNSHNAKTLIKRWASFINSDSVN